ncbi:DUF6976 family protein [Bermanella sp. R86510]|uniref:DUF6976 family protein n=1 Tax=unclassified Bermanella TaxID=2627862 RepID=UPI0037C5CD28
MSNVSINSQLTDLASTIEKIESGEFLVIAADQSLLSQLPSGNWIGGSIPYFMSESGGVVSKDHIFVQSIEGIEGNAQPRITPYDMRSISRIAQDAPDNGFTIAILPAGSDVHAEYAQYAPSYDNMFFSPIVGWVAGVHLDDVENDQAKTVFGPGAMIMPNRAVAMHVSLPSHQVANVHTINLFEQAQGPKIRFNNTGFDVNQCTVDGQLTELSQYIQDNNIDTRLPLVADYNGINVNVSIQNVGQNNVHLYAPVFADLEYQFAAPITDYVKNFDEAVKDHSVQNAAYSCNCILNFLYSELEGKQTGDLIGPITFGEVAYQLLNQTLVYMTIDQQ